jgi:hypothetical protein
LRESLGANTPARGVLGVVAGRMVWHPLHFVMVQRMLRGIMERAERQPLVLARVAQIGWCSPAYPSRASSSFGAAATSGC